MAVYVDYLQFIEYLLLAVAFVTTDYILLIGYHGSIRKLAKRLGDD